MAPEHPFPTPINECYAVTKSIFENSAAHGIDSNRIVLAGDSAGGNVVAVLTQRFLREKRQMPKLQVLVYPWLQMVNQRFPSYMQYEGKGLLSLSNINFLNYVSWYLGVTNITDEVHRVFYLNEHFTLFDESTQNKYMSFLDLKIIPEKYKKNKGYYSDYEVLLDLIYPRESSDSANAFKKNTELVRLMKQLYLPDISPLLANDVDLVGLPKAYLIVLEWDSLKDEGLLYAERLKKAGVQVQMAFYENAFHGIVSLINPYLGYQKARDMQNDLINYLKLNI